MSMRMTRTVLVSKWRKSARKVWRLISAIAPAISTPVGPAPTIAKVRAACRAAASVSISACSNARRNRDRMRVASSIVFSPGASGAQWS